MRNQKGSISMFVIISVLFFVFILVGMYASYANKLKAQEEQLEAIQDNYGEYDSEDGMDELYIAQTQQEDDGNEDEKEETGVSNETTWTSGVDYTFEPILNEYPNKSTGVLKSYNNWCRTPYLYCQGASKLRVTATATTGELNAGVSDNAFYDANKNYVGTFNYAGLGSVESGKYVEIDIPDNASYFILSGSGGRFPNTGGSTANGCILLTPYE